MEKNTGHLGCHFGSRIVLVASWSNTNGGRMRVEQSLLAEPWNPAQAKLGFDPDDTDRLSPNQPLRNWPSRTDRVELVKLATAGSIDL
jgi:hypothetical protein